MQDTTRTQALIAGVELDALPVCDDGDTLETSKQPLNVLLVTASRAFDEDGLAWCERVLRSAVTLWRIDAMFVGDARGGDHIALRVAGRYRLMLRRFCLDGSIRKGLRGVELSSRWWEGAPQHGKHWPPIRNQAIVDAGITMRDLGHRVACLALYATPKPTGGTYDTAGRARRAGLITLEKHFLPAGTEAPAPA
jgi:hypothetical protein